MSRTLVAAKEYLRRGYRLVLLHGSAGEACTCSRPDCSAIGKHPVERAWNRRPIRLAAELEEHWARRAGQPTNIGILLDRGDRLLLIDEDNKKGKRGADTIRAWEERLGVCFDQALVQSTPTGGRHYLFRIPEGFPVDTLPNGAAAPGVDVLRQNRQFVAFPSETPTGRYRCSHEDGQEVSLPPVAELPEVPAGLLDLLAELPGAGRSHRTPPQDLAALRAPSMEKLQEVVAHIPNGADVDRDTYVWMASGIKAAGGPENEVRAEEIFLKWAAKYPTPDPGEDARVFETLGWKDLYHGWPELWKAAAEHGYNAHAERYAEAAEAFEADPAAAGSQEPPAGRPITRLLSETGLDRIRNVDWEDVPNVLGAVADRLPTLHPSHGELIRAIARSGLQKRLGSGLEAERLLQRFLVAAADSGPFQHVSDGSPQLRVLSADDIDVQRPAYLVDNLIPAAAVGAFIGDYSVGKSWLAIDLGLSIAFGHPWLGHRSEEGPVLFLVAEGTRGFPGRIHGWLNARRYLPGHVTLDELFGTLEGRVVISRYPVQFDDPDAEAGLIATVKDHGIHLLTVDTLGKSLGPEQGENDNDVANAVTGMLSRIANATGCTCVVTHHTGYQDRGRPRGASAWTQGLDFAYVITGGRVALAAGQPVDLNALKLRDDVQPQPMKFRLKAVEGLAFEDQEGRTQPFSSAVVEPELKAEFSVDPGAYTAGTRNGENLRALHLALGVLVELGAVASGVKRRAFVDKYNERLKAMSAEAESDEAETLSDTASKNLLGRLCHSPFVRRIGAGPRTVYVVAENGRQLAVGSFSDFEVAWAVGWTAGEELERTGS